MSLDFSNIDIETSHSLNLGAMSEPRDGQEAVVRRIQMTSEQIFLLRFRQSQSLAVTPHSIQMSAAHISLDFVPIFKEKAIEDPTNSIKAAIDQKASQMMPELSHRLAIADLDVAPLQCFGPMYEASLMYAANEITSHCTSEREDNDEYKRVLHITKDLLNERVKEYLINNRSRSIQTI